MGLLDAVKSKLGGHRHEVPAGGRMTLTKSIAAAVREHAPELAGTDLSHYTYERRQTMYQGAAADLVIYDEYGGQAFKGRELDAGRIILWR
jgi:hypothetical protein